MKASEFGALICWHTDRLYRNMADLERVIEIADANRIEIRTVQGGTLDLSTSAGRMVARILGSVARQESEHTSERAVATMPPKTRRSPGSEARATSTTTIAASQPNMRGFPGRCTECQFHVETQGHRDGCSQTAPVTPEREPLTFLDLAK